MNEFKVYFLGLSLCLLPGIHKAQASISISTNNFCSGEVGNATANSGTLSAASYTWSESSGNVSIGSPNTPSTVLLFNTAGNYTIHLAINSGTVISQSQATLHVDATPTIVITGATTLCAGQSTSLTASGAFSYTWSNGVVGASVVDVFTISFGTSYTVLATSIQGCVVSAATLVHYGIYPLPQIATTSFSVCTGATATITMYGANSYSLMGSPPIPFQSTIAVTAGNYAFIASNGGGCTSFSGITIGTLDCATSLKAQALNENQFKIFPNPARDFITIHSEVSKAVIIELTDITGKNIRTEDHTFAHGDVRIGITELSAGIYFVRIHSRGKAVEVRRILKE